MKKFNLYIAMLFALIIATSSCKSDDPMINISQEEAFMRLAGQWAFGVNGSIVLDGTDVSANYPGFALSFANGTYTTTNSAELFSASGTWEWTDQEARSLRLDNDKSITILALTENSFIFNFSFSRSTRAGIAGNYTVTLNK